MNKPLTLKEQRTLDRLQIRWHLGRLTTEEKQYAVALSKRDQRCKARTADVDEMAYSKAENDRVMNGVA